MYLYESIAWLLGKMLFRGMVAGALGGAIPYLIILLVNGEAIGSLVLMTGAGIVIGGLFSRYVDEVVKPENPRWLSVAGFMGGLFMWLLLGVSRFQSSLIAG